MMTDVSPNVFLLHSLALEAASLNLSKLYKKYTFWLSYVFMLACAKLCKCQLVSHSFCLVFMSCGSFTAFCVAIIHHCVNNGGVGWWNLCKSQKCDHIQSLSSHRKKNLTMGKFILSAWICYLLMLDPLVSKVTASIVWTLTGKL